MLDMIPTLQLFNFRLVNLPDMSVPLGAETRWEESQKRGRKGSGADRGVMMSQTADRCRAHAAGPMLTQESHVVPP